MLDPDNVVAVVGMAAKFPGARDIDEFWLNLVRGKESVAVRTDDELLAAGVPAEALSDSAYVKVASMVPDAEYFDAGFFRMTPREATLCDPQIRLFLEIAHSAIEHAGYDPTRIGDGVGVFASGGPAHYAEQHLAGRDDLITRGGLSVETLNHSDYVATTVAYKLDLRGPSFTVLTACSSTLVALYLAVQALRVGECDMAVVGGADVEFPYGHGYLWAPGGVRSRDGHCRPFDEAASGTVFGGGAGAVLVKRLSDALADRDHISAVIRGVALNNDGGDKVSFGAPSVSGQVRVISEAMAVAGVAPADISYVEAHGTGTALGDPIEVSALAEAYTRMNGSPLPPGTCALGSVKSNFGHLGPVAGMAGLIKTVLSLDREQLPPSINFTAPNPKLELESTPFRVNDTLTGWARDPRRPRRASVSSMGIGGANVHVVLEEAPVRTHAPHAGEPRLVVWSGRSVEAERAGRERLARYFTGCGEEVFADAVATLQHGRTAHPVRAAAVCASAHDAAAALTGEGAGHVVTLGRKVRAPLPVTLLFPGQGAQQVRMAAGLYGHVPSFTAEFDHCLDLFADAGLLLRPSWLGEATAVPVHDTLAAQPLLFAVELALARMWQTMGVTPVALLGHSIGELVAATVGGVFTDAAGAALVAARARAMAGAPAGGMLAVAADEAVLADEVGGSLRVAAVNGPAQIVLSGPVDDLEACAAALRERGVAATMLRTSGAFHHPMLADAADEFEKAFAGIEARPPVVPVYSAATGRPLTGEEAMDPAFWAGQLVRPVRFAAALDAALAAEEGILIETGPGRGLVGLVGRHPAVERGAFHVVGTLPRRAGDGNADRAALLGAAARLWTGGHELDWTEAGQGEPEARVPVPGYPYQRERYWVDRVARAQPAGEAATPAAEVAVEAAAEVAVEVAVEPAPDPTAQTGTPFSTVVWRERQGGPVSRVHGAGTALVFQPDDPARALDIVLAVQQAGFRAVRVRPAASYANGPGDEFAVRPAAPEDVDRVLDALAARGVQPDLVVYAAAAATAAPVSTATVDTQLDLAFFGPLALVQRGLRTGRTGRLPQFVVISTGAVDVSGSEPVEPVKAALPAFVRTLVAETPWLTARCIDVSARTPIGELADELCRHDGGRVVALRGTRRWIPREEPLPVAPAAPPPIRRGGVYVITGGLGGLGIEVAKGLAATGLRPRLALLGRRIPPAGEELERLLAAGDEWTTRVHAGLEDLRMTGAEVRTIACDVGDPRQVRRALDVVNAHFGPPNGLLHLAGVAGDGMLQVREPARAADVLRPKVLGTLVLAEALGGRPELDFLVFFSSRAAVDGLVGSGDYAAANAFLDLYASTPGLPADRVLSVNFPSWTRVGMAARPGDAVAAAQSPAPAGGSAPDAPVWETVLSQENAWTLDEHRLGDRPLLPGTGHLDLVLQAYRAAVAVPAADPAVVLSDVAFALPLVAVTPRRVRVEFTPDGERHRFAVLSRPEGEPTEAWVRHVTGRAERQPADAPVADLTGVRSAMTELPLPATDGPRRMFVLGPRWHAVRARYGRDGERIVDLELPAAFHSDLPAHAVHPALLDCATAAARDPEDPFHVPFLYRRLVIHAPLPAVLSAHVRRRPAAMGLIVADVDLVDPRGRVLVQVEGFTMRQVDDAAFGHEPVGAVEIRPSAEPASTAAPAAPAVAAEAPAVPDTGIEPEIGCQLLFTLLGARTPEQVAVRPYVHGAPVPFAAPAEVPVPDAAVQRASVPQPPPQPNGAAPAAPTTAPATAPATVPATGGSVEDRLRQLWWHALGVTEIELDDDFFELGGNSMTAVELMSRIRETFGVELNIGLLFDAPTLRQLTALLQDQNAG